MTNARRTLLTLGRTIDLRTSDNPQAAEAPNENPSITLLQTKTFPHFKKVKRESNRKRLRYRAPTCSFTSQMRSTLPAKPSIVTHSTTIRKLKTQNQTAHKTKLRKNNARVLRMNRPLRKDRIKSERNKSNSNSSHRKSSKVQAPVLV